MFGNGRFESTVFNSRLQPTQIALGTSANNTSLLKLNYDYGTTDNNGNVKQQTITVTGMTHPLIQTYAYDSLNRLQSATETSNSIQTWKQTFIYDRYGNRRFDMANTTVPDSQSNQNITNPQIDTSNNRFSANQGYDYDQSGNVTKDATDKRFVYDAENKQASFGTSGSSTNGGSYFYDGDGRRVKKVVGTETTIFVYNASGQMVAEYATTAPTNPQISYLTTDTLGSPRINTDANGQVTARHDYLPFGEEITTLGGRTTDYKYGQVDNVKQKFTGQLRDGETGLDYFNARYYSSIQGRFTSPDEFTGGPDELFDFADDAADNPTFYADLENPQSLNKYQYAYNNPMLYTDPDGHCPDCPSKKEIVLDVVQTAISIAGFIPGAGDVADVVNAGISAARGNYGEAVLDLASAATGPVGNAIAVTKRTGKLINTARKITSKTDDAVDTAKDTSRVSSPTKQSSSGSRQQTSKPTGTDKARADQERKKSDTRTKAQRKADRQKRAKNKLRKTDDHTGEGPHHRDPTQGGRRGKRK
jgi:RHS repeat-associated protein